MLLPEIATPELRDRLVREAMAASALNHPGICTIHDLISVESRYLIVMELVEGRTLLDALAGGPLAPAQAVAIGAQVADALAEAHRAGILHRDVKPGNIMLIPGGHTKLLDFGLAKRFDEPGAGAGAGVTREGTVVGTLGYLSPEQLLARKVDERSDLFALGVVLYEIVAGRRPFQGGSAIATADAILHSPPPPMGSAVPERLQAVIRRLLEKDPDRRFASAGQVVEEMRVLQAGMARRLRWRRSRAAAVTAGAITVLATIVGG